jgi:hypothetical protein
MRGEIRSFERANFVRVRRRARFLARGLELGPLERGSHLLDLARGDGHRREGGRRRATRARGMMPRQQRRNKNISNVVAVNNKR